MGEYDRESVVRRHYGPGRQLVLRDAVRPERAFTAIVGRQHPGCTDAANFLSATKGTWNGVWTQKVSGEFDYNPDVTIDASTASWDDFIAHVFGDDGDRNPTVTFVSYEFDYDACGFHCRDAQYSPDDPSNQSGTIGDSSVRVARSPAFARGSSLHLI
jgi:hypothetical protein